MSLLLSRKDDDAHYPFDNPPEPRIEQCEEHGVPNDAAHYLTEHFGPKKNIAIFDLETLLED